MNGPQTDRLPEKISQDPCALHRSKIKELLLEHQSISWYASNT